MVIKYGNLVFGQFNKLMGVFNFIEEIMLEYLANKFRAKRHTNEYEPFIRFTVSH